MRDAKRCHGMPARRATRWCIEIRAFGNRNAPTSGRVSIGDNDSRPRLGCWHSGGLRVMSLIGWLALTSLSAPNLQHSHKVACHSPNSTCATCSPCRPPFWASSWTPLAHESTRTEGRHHIPEMRVPLHLHISFDAWALGTCSVSERLQIHAVLRAHQSREPGVDCDSARYLSTSSGLPQASYNSTIRCRVAESSWFLRHDGMSLFASFKAAWASTSNGSASSNLS